MSEKELTFLGHLEEFRRVLIKSFFAFLGTSALALGFSPYLFRWLKYPLQHALPSGWHFIATTPFEIYSAYIRVALTFGILLAAPIIFHFFWSFIHPGLHPNERRGVMPAAIACGLLFLGGALFGYFVVFPPAYGFVVELLQGTDVMFFPKVSDYLSFALRLLIAFGIVFELPLFLLLLGRFGLVRAKQLNRYRKYVIVAIFLAAGILTPGPDVLSQVLMAIPLLFLFEIGVVLVRVFGKNPAKKLVSA